MNSVAPSLKIKMPTSPQDSIVDIKVHLVGSLRQLDMGLRVELFVKVRGLTREELDSVVHRAEQVCPYSRATRGNVHTVVRSEVL